MSLDQSSKPCLSLETVKDKKSDAEITVLSGKIVKGEVSADSLSTKEFLYSASLTPSLQEKEAIYKAAIKKEVWSLRKLKHQSIP